MINICSNSKIQPVTSKIRSGSPPGSLRIRRSGSPETAGKGRPARGDALGGTDRRRRRVPARHEPSRFPGRIDTARLQRHRGHAGQPHDEDGHQRDDRESRLDRDGPGVRTGYVAVFRARLMMLVSAFTTESPVMTV